MGTSLSSKKRFHHYDVTVGTGDLKGSGTDSHVYIALHDIKENRSIDIELNYVLQNNFRRGSTDHFRISSGVTSLADLKFIEIWRDTTGLFDDWFCEIITVVDLRTKKKFVFPVHRWIQPHKVIHLQQYDMALPQDDEKADQRREELESRKQTYQLAHIENIDIPRIKNFPSDEAFSDDYKWDIRSIALKVGIAAKIRQFTTEKFKSLDDVEGLYNPPLLPKQLAVHNWRCDKEFGYNRMNGCNPSHIRICTQIPDSFAVNEESLKPILEGMTIKETVERKRLFIINFEFLRDLPCQDGEQICAPKALFFVNTDKYLVPVAIQLFPDPTDDNPVFYPTDPEYTWLLAKMYFCNADVCIHQAGSHFGMTHIVMESAAIATHHCLSPSHPIFRLLAPHFLFIIAINNKGLDLLMGKGSVSDTLMVTGTAGVNEIINRIWKNWSLDRQGSFLKDLRDRGVDDPEVLPNYHYRDDALLFHSAIQEYVRTIVEYFYDSPGKIEGDHELQEWGRVLSGSKSKTGEITVKMKGVPNDGNFRTTEDISEVVTNFIFICSVTHAAVNFGMYDQYAFPPSYPGWLHGDPPSSKDPVSEEEVFSRLPSKRDIVQWMTLSKVLSERGTQPLGDFEVQYIYHPVGLQALEKFRKDLVKAGEIIDERNRTRETPYTYLHPREVPNSISI
nr:polyunsaturated fatty acid 5-lipoxygenase-like isoform X1 [Lytechinus pictus]